METIEEMKINYDQTIMPIMKNLKVKATPVIKGDISYNIIYIPEFESFAYYNYLQLASIDIQSAIDSQKDNARDNADELGNHSHNNLIASDNKMKLELHDDEERKEI